MRTRIIFGLSMLAVLAACTPANSDGQAAQQRAAAAITSTEAHALTLRPVAAGLSRPLDLENAGDGSGRLFVVEQDGRVRVVADGKLQPEPFLDIATVPDCDLGGTSGRRALGFTPSSSGEERGLLGLAFHPAFRSNGLLFVDYTDGEGDTVVAQFHTKADGQAVDVTSCVVMLRVDQTFPNHNGGDVEFGPDGLLYIGLGDGGSANDPCNHATTLTAAALVNSRQCAAHAAFTASAGNPDSRALLGKILRIDVDHQTAPGKHGLCASRGDGSAAYATPSDNALAKTGADTCAEIWTFGWRNPWRFSFDRKSGDLYVGDVGQNEVEEITRVAHGTAAGGNYGWRGCEGNRDANGGHCAGTLPPLLTYRHEHGRCSITGGVVYRGPDKGLQGRYLFGDFCSGEIFVADLAGGHAEVWPIEPARSNGLAIASFGEDEAGRAYVIDLGAGAVFELQSAR
jgi:glucose/arabinose dehydrogenase